MPVRRPKRRKSPGDPGPPYIGALLRLSWRRVRAHIHAAIREAGFDDLQDAHFAAFSYPRPDGVRPSDFARQLRMSRQAANYLLSQLEALGYFERRAAKGRSRRLVYLTRRGDRVVDTIYVALRELEEQWAAEIGTKRFDEFMDVLRRLAADA